MSESTSKILFVGLNYLPEQTGIAPYTGGMARGLARAGARVRVITGLPHYPQWSVQPWTNEAPREGEPLVSRVTHLVPSAPRFLNRALMEVEFGLKAALKNWASPDVVVAVSPALFSTGIVVAKARLTRTPVVVWVQDIYSRGLEETAGKSTASEIVKRIEGLILRQASGVVVIHQKFSGYLAQELGVDPGRIDIVRNWTHIAPKALDKAQARRELGWPEDRGIVLHAGAMGRKQGLENVVEAARLAQADGDVQFILLGDGNQRQQLEQLGEGVTALQFVDPLDDQGFDRALAAADILLVNELVGLREMCVPSKLTTYFATRRPVLAATEADSATAEEVESAGAGVRVEPGNPAALLAAARRILSGSEADSLGENGPRYVERVLRESTAIERMTAALQRRMSGLSPRP